MGGVVTENPRGKVNVAAAEKGDHAGSVASKKKKQSCVRHGDVWPNTLIRPEITNVGQTVGRFRELAAGTIEVELFAIPSDGRIVIRRRSDHCDKMSGRILNVGRMLGQFTVRPMGDIEIELQEVPPDGKFVIDRTMPKRPSRRSGSSIAAYGKD